MNHDEPGDYHRILCRPERQSMSTRMCVLLIVLACALGVFLSGCSTAAPYGVIAQRFMHEHYNGTCVSVLSHRWEFVRDSQPLRCFRVRTHDGLDWCAQAFQLGKRCG